MCLRHYVIARNLALPLSAASGTIVSGVTAGNEDEAVVTKQAHMQGENLFQFGDCFGHLAALENVALATTLLEKGRNLLRMFGDFHARGFQCFDFVCGGACATFDDRARVSHPFAGRRGLTCDERNDRFGHLG